MNVVLRGQKWLSSCTHMTSKPASGPGIKVQSKVPGHRLTMCVQASLPPIKPGSATPQESISAMKTPSDQTAQDEGVGLDLTAAQISELPLYSRAEFDFAASAGDELSFSVMCLSLIRNSILLPLLTMCFC